MGNNCSLDSVDGGISKPDFSQTLGLPSSIPSHSTKYDLYRKPLYFQSTQPHLIRTLTKSPPRRALITVTSASAPLFKGTDTTGLFVTEATHPFNVFIAAGFVVDLTSETGAYTPDWLSMTPDFLSGDKLATWEDPNSAFRQKLDNMPNAADVDASKYGVFFASAGHAALIDYPAAANLKKIAASV